ncbi:MAG: M67 family metallopeptidase [Deltaproteobacteria bacterium]|nr:MAG: M67 family metallopeptidase [Deltaproteobacteria bacterium]
MPQRVEVDPNLSPAIFPSRVLNEICAHARETLPEECCGLIAGDARVRQRLAYPCRNEMTRRHQLDPANFPRDGREGFYMNQLDYLKAVQEAEASGLRITAVYHSHVGFGVYLSEMDLEYALHEAFPFPDADHIVIAVFDGKITDVGLFERDPEASFLPGRFVLAGSP